MATRFWSQSAGILKSIFTDPLHRGTLLLLANSAVLQGSGFLFWTLAAHAYSARTVGIFSGVTAGVGLLGAVAALGLPNTVTRHIASAENPRELIAAAVGAVVTVGGVLSFAVATLLGPHVPPSLHLQQRGSLTVFLIALVVFTSLGGILDSGLVAKRASAAVLIKNSAASVVKLFALFVFSTFRSAGLLIAYGVGLILATTLSGAALGRKAERGSRFKPVAALKQYMPMTAANYFATVIGILPSTVVPLEVLAERGAAQTARFTVAFMIAGVLNVIPSTTASVLFAEASRQGITLGKQVRKALRSTYSLLIPVLLFLIAAAPLVLRIFGAGYASEATGCMRVMSLSAVFAGGTYLVDAMLIARDRRGAYTITNVANAVMILGLVGLLLRHGLTGAAIGWDVGQALSLLVGVVLLATGRSGRHRFVASRDQEPGGRLHPGVGILADGDADWRIQRLLAEWPMMPTTLVAERIGWDQSVQDLVQRVAELRPAYLADDERKAAKEPPGALAHCGIWYPPVEIPVGPGRVRSARSLPVLTVISSYSRWLAAVLIPSEQGHDLLPGLFNLLTLLGGVPQRLVWDDARPGIVIRDGADLRLTGECRAFCRATGARVAIARAADPRGRDLLERAHAYLEGSFVPGRRFASPGDFNRQLSDWIDAANTRPRQHPNRSPLELIEADRHGMRPLPRELHLHPQRVPAEGARRPFIYCDGHAYAVPPGLAGKMMEVVVDPSLIRVFYRSRIVAEHRRVWADGAAVNRNVGTGTD